MEAILTPPLLGRYFTFLPWTDTIIWQPQPLNDFFVWGLAVGEGRRWSVFFLPYFLRCFEILECSRQNQFKFSESWNISQFQCWVISKTPLTMWDPQKVELNLTWIIWIKSEINASDLSQIKSEKLSQIESKTVSQIKPETASRIKSDMVSQI